MARTQLNQKTIKKLSSDLVPAMKKVQRKIAREQLKQHRNNLAKLKGLPMHKVPMTNMDYVLRLMREAGEYPSTALRKRRQRS